MDHLLSFTDAILIIGAFQGLILSIMLLLKHNRNLIANKILAFIILLLSFSVTIHTLGHSNILSFLYDHSIIIGSLSNLIAPLIFLYVKTLTTYNYKLKYFDLLNLLPFAITVILIIIIYQSIFQESIEIFLIYCNYSINFAVIFGYIAFSNIILFKHTNLIKRNYSNIEKINLRWLKIFISSLTLFWMFAGVCEVFVNSIPWDILWLFSCFIIYLIGYFGFIQPEIFFMPLSEETYKKENRKYEKSSLSLDLSSQYLEKLNQMMATEKVFLEKDINLVKLSHKLKIQVHHLSQIINEQIGMNFYDYINSQRVIEAQKLLSDKNHHHLSIASIAYESGFNSISAFNSAFKKFVQKTPSNFRKDCLN